MGWRTSVRKHINAKKSALKQQEYNRKIDRSNEEERIKDELAESQSRVNYYQSLINKT